MTVLTFDELAVRLAVWGYKVTKEPMEQRPPGMIELKYDMDMIPADVTCQEYKVTHEVELSFTAATPGGISGQIATLMGRLGKEYSAGNLHFEMGKPKLTRGNGTMYIVTIAVSWVTFQIVDT